MTDKLVMDSVAFEAALLRLADEIASKASRASGFEGRLALVGYARAAFRYRNGSRRSSKQAPVSDRPLGFWILLFIGTT